MKKRLSVLLAAALFAALLLTGCPNKDKAPDASGEESSAAAGETDAEPDSAESADSGEPTPSDTTSADVSSPVSGADTSAENTSRQTTQTKAGNAAQTTAKLKPGQTTAATKATQTTAKPFAALPLKTQWILKPSLNYETVIPTTDGKNWIGSRKSSGGEENFLINTAGKVLAQADFMNYGTQQQFGDRIVAKKGAKYALLSTDGKVILNYQEKSLFFYGDYCLIDKTTETSQERELVKIDRSGKEIGKYEGIVGYGAMKEDIYLFDQKNKIVYSATTIYDAQVPYHIVDFCKGPTICKSASKKYVALVGENIKDKSVEELIPSFFGYGAVINGELKSTTLYKELSLLKGFSDWRRDLYIAGTGTEYLFANTAGKAVLTEKFVDLSANENCTAAAVKQNGKWGFIRVPEL